MCPQRGPESECEASRTKLELLVFRMFISHIFAKKRRVEIKNDCERKTKRYRPGMEVIKVPVALREKLGPDASEGLIEMFSTYGQHQETRLVRVLRDDLSLRIQESEQKLEHKIHQSELRMLDQLRQSEQRLEEKVHKTELKLTDQIQQSEGRMEEKIHQTELKLTHQIQAVESRTGDKIEALRKDTHAGFIEVHKQIAGIHTQISVQTRWLIGFASFLAAALKLADIFLP